MANSNRAEQAIEALEGSGFVEEQRKAPAKSEVDVNDYALEDRLTNWGRVFGAHRRTGGGASTFWASEYIAGRNNREFQMALRLGLIERQTVLQQIEQQAFSEAAYQDAEMIEAAWTLLPVFDHKQILQLKYVGRVADDYIRRKLRLRGRENLALILWRAKTSMQKILDQPKKQVYSSNHNLIAGVPCLKSVPKGGVDTPE